MLKKIQLTFTLTLGFIALCISAIILNLHTWNFVSCQQGYDTFIYYQGRGFKCKTFTPTANQKEWRRIYAKYEKEIERGESFPEKERFAAIEHQADFDEALRSFIADGVFFLFSITGLIILWIRREKVRLERAAGRLGLYSWLSILIVLYCHWFIMEFVFKVIEAAMGISADFGNWISWPANYLHLNGWFFLSFNCLVSLLVLGYITFRIVPRRQLVPFLLSGLAGGILSRMVWYSWLGPILMPFT